MEYIEHLAVGVFVLMGLYLLNQQYFHINITWISWIYLIAIWFVYSQLPDIDQQGSKINTYVVIAIVLAGIWFFYKNQLMYALLCFAGIIGIQLLHHRTIVHTIIFGVILSAPLWFIQPWMAAVALVLFSAHLMADGQFVLWDGQ